MGQGKAGFIKFVQRLFEIFSDVFFQNEDILTVASYFWEALELNQKLEWKEYAKVENIEKNLTGKRKINGFWLFAKKLINAIHIRNITFFEDIWNCMAREERSLWEIQDENEIDAWIERQISFVLGNKPL